MILESGYRFSDRIMRKRIGMSPQSGQRFSPANSFGCRQIMRNTKEA
jgi:hypothetical protein